MEIVKKNIISIICGVVALAAVGVALFVVPGKKAELQTAVDSSATNNKALADLLSKPRQMPVVNPDNPEQQALEQFPSEAVIKRGEEITGQVEAESKKMLEAAVKMNQKQLLVPGSLPTPSSTSAFAFRNTYRTALPLPVQPQPGQVPTPAVLRSRFAQELKAGMPPTADEISVAGAAMVKEIESKELYFTPDGQAANAEQVKLKIEERSKKLPAEMRDKVVQSSKVYVNPETFEINVALSNSAGAPDPLSIYSAQLSYWIQSDVVAAVNEVNAKSNSVAESPVKHLIRIRTKPYNQVAPIFITGPEMTANADANAQLPKVPMASTTGRVSNGLYDVFHFEVEADVEADRLPDFLRSLGNKRFITPLYVDLQARDNARALAEGLVYGEKPVVTVRAECEILYLRAWNQNFMPPLLKQKLGIGVEGVPADAAQPAAGTDPMMDPGAAPPDVPAGP